MKITPTASPMAAPTKVKPKMWTHYLLVSVTFCLLATNARAAQQPPITTTSSHSQHDGERATMPSRSDKMDMLLEKILTQCSADIVRPVCATNGTGYTLLPNGCALREINRQRFAAAPTFTVAAMNLCRPSCKLQCDERHKTICAYDKDKNVKHTFKNMCEMATNMCLTETAWMVENDNACMSTKKVLSFPVTESAVPLPHSSAKHGHKVVPRSVTDYGKPKVKKPIPCPRVFNPVCATFAGVKSTFINECLVNAENVKTGNVWEIFSEGVCAEDYSRTIHRTVASRSTSDDNFNLMHDPAFNVENNVLVDPPIAHTQHYDDSSRPQFSVQGQQVVHNVMTASVRQTHSRLPPTAHMVTVDDKVPECKFGSTHICGTLERRTRDFGNVCELILRNIFLNQTWSVLNEGECECKLNCNDDFEPICVARNGINYTIVNECFLDYGMCQDRQSTWKVLHMGECPVPLKRVIADKYTSVAPGFRFTSNYGTNVTPSIDLRDVSTWSTTTASPSTSTLKPATSVHVGERTNSKLQLTQGSVPKATGCPNTKNMIKRASQQTEQKADYLNHIMRII